MAYCNPNVEKRVRSNNSVIRIVRPQMRRLNQAQSSLDKKWLRETEANASQAGKNARQKLETKVRDESPEKRVLLDVVYLRNLSALSIFAKASLLTLIPFFLKTRGLASRYNG